MSCYVTVINWSANRPICIGMMCNMYCIEDNTKRRVWMIFQHIVSLFFRCVPILSVSFPTCFNDKLEYVRHRAALFTVDGRKQSAAINLYLITINAKCWNKGNSSGLLLKNKWQGSLGKNMQKKIELTIKDFAWIIVKLLYCLTGNSPQNSENK